MSKLAPVDEVPAVLRGPNESTDTELAVDPATSVAPASGETVAGETVPVGPVLSIFDPVYLGIDEYGHPVYIPIPYWNLLAAGDPGSGKSSLLNTILGHATLSMDCRLCLLDGKRVELGLWRQAADVFIGPSIDDAISGLLRLQQVMDNRYAYLEAVRRRKVVKKDLFSVILLAIDELAFYSVTTGEKHDQDYFSTLVRDIVARGRAVGIPVVAATQRPSSDIIPTSLRDLFAWRFAGHCTTDSSSDIILGRGWADKGYSANSIPPENRGVGYLIAETGIPRLIKGAYLTDEDIIRLADYGAWIRDPKRKVPKTFGTEHADTILAEMATSYPAEGTDSRT